MCNKICSKYPLRLQNKRFSIFGPDNFFYRNCQNPVDRQANTGSIVFSKQKVWPENVGPTDDDDELPEAIKDVTAGRAVTFARDVTGVSRLQAAMFVLAQIQETRNQKLERPASPAPSVKTGRFSGTLHLLSTQPKNSAPELVNDE